MDMTSSGLTAHPVAAEDWDRLVSCFADLIQEQMQCHRDSRKDGGDVVRLAFYDNKELCGAALARRVRLPLIGTPIHMLRWGPLWQLAGEAPRADRLPRLYQAIAAELADKDRGLLLLQPRAEPEASFNPMPALLAAGFRPTEAEPVSPERYFVDVSAPSDLVFKSLKQKWRYNLKKAMTAGLTADWDNTAEGFDVFYRLYRELVERKQFFDFAPVEAAKERLLNAPEHLRPKIIIVRSAEGEPVAAAVVDCLGARPVYLYGATSHAALALRAGYFLQWKIVEELCADPKAHWYELGGGNSPSCPLHQFKRGLAGRDGQTADEPCLHWLAGGVLMKSLFPLVLRAQRAKRQAQMVHNWCRQKTAPRVKADR